MYEFLMWFFLLFAIVGIVFSWHHTFKIAFYETLLERYQNEAGIKLPEDYNKVKNDFWMWIK